MKKYNINEYVYVKLTEEGKRLLEEFYDSMGLIGEIKTLFPTTRGGYTRFQLYEIALIFGKHLYNGSTTQLFFNNDLVFDDNHLRDTNILAKKPR